MPKKRPLELFNRSISASWSNRWGWADDHFGKLPKEDG